MLIVVTFGQLVFTEAAKITLLPATATPVAAVTATLSTVTTSVPTVTGSSPAVETSTHTETATLNEAIETTTTPAVGNEDDSSSLTPNLFVISNGLPLSDPLVQSIADLIQESQNPNHNEKTTLERTVTESDLTEIHQSSTVVPTTTTLTSSIPSSSQTSTLLNLITPSSSSLPRTSTTETISTTFPSISTSSTKLTSTTSSTTTTSRRSTPTTSIPRSTTESSTTLTSQETTSSYPTEASIIWALPPNAPLDTWTYFTQSPQYSRKVNPKGKLTEDPPTKDKHTAKPKTYRIQNPYNWMPAYYFELGPLQSDYVPARYGQPSSEVYHLRVKPKYSGLSPNIPHRRPTTEYGYGHTGEHDYRPINHDRPYSQDESVSGLYSGHRLHQHDQEQLDYGEGYGNGPYTPFGYQSGPRGHFEPFNMMRSPIGLGRGQISKYRPENIHEDLAEYGPINIHEDQYNLREHSGHGYGPYRYMFPGPGPLNEHRPFWTT